MKILVIGSGGMAGHVVAMGLAQRGHRVLGMSRRSSAGTDIVGDATSEAMMDGLLSAGRYDAVVNCAGLLNSECDRDPERAVALNSLLPRYLQRKSIELAFHLVHISTDCVFSGDGTGPYSESSRVDGTSMYARTKALGEAVGPRTIVLRTSIVGPDTRRDGIGLLNWFMSMDGEVRGYTNAIWSGVTTDVLARAVESVAESRLNGLRHLTNGGGISKRDLLSLFNRELRGGSVRITDYPDFRNDKTLVTSHSDLGIKVPGYEEMVRGMALLVRSNRDLYPHYKL